ncbi:hypothetical protein V474_06905 [Novosphingobium barchaimii LL02]|uniref:ChsH2 C-terminal OB-fold domain-containing protein n=1 Tax=Novosphingobium barchaimii LL02 TaxID=1114963 RepID=A0A0J7XHD0_9SPHN|nr:OB-fold domain-containing protein [Novosphingobium barchaimii]KMS50538.1 hypothetical protein V474_06905 [Novosphingobium barchaimii LL02]
MTSPASHWREALAQGRFLLQRAGDGSAIFPPRLAAPGSGTDDLEWIEASGLGTVYTLSWVQRRPPAEPYNVALIDLDEGARLMSRVEGMTPETLRIGQRVSAFIDSSGEQPVLLFRAWED